jgi:hypothetical protein
MNSLPYINLRDLVTRYRDSTPAAGAARLLAERKGDPAFLNRLLRYHGDEGVYDSDEIDHRDAVDDLLSFYSLIEIACLVGVVPQPDEWPPDLKAAATADLTDPSVRRYYEDFYPLALPVLLRRRLQGPGVTVESQTGVGYSPFMQFLDVNAIVLGDEQVKTFLMFLDSFHFGGVSLSDLCEVMAEPASFFRHMAVEPADQEAIQHGLHGFLKFLTFCRELDMLIVRAADHPAFQSAAWLHYGYWLDGLRSQVGAFTDTAITHLAEWQVRLDDSTESSTESRESLEDLRRVMGRLLSDRYRPTAGSYARVT